MPEPTRQSLSGCCSQPEHGPTLSHQMSHGAEKERGPTGTRTQGLSLTVRALYHWANEPLDRPVTFSPCLIRFVPESARIHAGTVETVPLLLAARARTHTEPPNVTGAEKERGPTGTRTQGLSLTVRALYHWATEPLDRPVTFSPCLIRFVPESARIHAGTVETVPLLLAARARTHTEPPNVTGAEKERGPTGTRTQGLSLTVRALYHWANEPLDRPVTFFPHTSHQMSQGRKKNVARPGLEPRVSRLPCEHSTTELPSHSIDRLHFSPTLATKCHRGGKRTWPDRDSNPGSLAYRASTLPLSYRATRSTGYNSTKETSSYTSNQQLTLIRQLLYSSKRKINGQSWPGRVGPRPLI